MEQIKAAVWFVTVTGIQFFDQFKSEIDAGVLFARRFGGVRQICEQGVADVGIAVDEIADFQIFDKLADLFFIDK